MQYRNWLYCFSYLLFFPFLIFTQNGRDSSHYELYQDQWVIDVSTGYNTTNFSISDKFESQRERIKYRANMNPTIGFGVSYKLLALGISFKTPGYIRNTETFGTTLYTDLDLSFQLKNWLFLGDFHWYEGFSARLPDQSIQLNERLRSYSVRINTYYFTNDNYALQAARGITGRYNEETISLFAKATAALHGIANTNSPLLPNNIFDNSKTIWKARRVSAFDVGIIPGVAYVNRVQNWQFGVITGLGGVMQSKFYRSPGVSRGFLGLAPRYDFQAQVGYNTKDWFIFLHTLLDNKSVRFNDYRYQQLYYFIRLTGGYRIPMEKTKRINFDFPEAL